jgi:putative flippase GtrA
MADRRTQWTPAGQHPLRHGLAFVLSGGTAFAVDATVLQGLTALLGVPAIAARVAAIALAMVAGWLMHRTFTFAVATSGHAPAGGARRVLDRGHGPGLSRHALWRLPSLGRA